MSKAEIVDSLIKSIGSGMVKLQTVAPKKKTFKKGHSTKGYKPMKVKPMSKAEKIARVILAVKAELNKEKLAVEAKTRKMKSIKAKENWRKFQKSDAILPFKDVKFDLDAPTIKKEDKQRILEYNLNRLINRASKPKKEEKFPWDEKEEKHPEHNSPRRRRIVKPDIFTPSDDMVRRIPRPPKLEPLPRRPIPDLEVPWPPITTTSGTGIMMVAPPRQIRYKKI
jgi:hypothetical protein